MSMHNSNKKSTQQSKWIDEQVKRAEAGVFGVQVKLTPELAQELLGRNPGNRNIVQTKIAQYELDMSMGAWTLNGEPIIISRDGLLNDGQHRCLAVASTGVSIDTMMIFGVERETRKTVDQGAIRSNAGRLSMEGVQNTYISAAIAGLVWQYETYGLVTKQAHKRPTQAAVEDTYFRYREEIERAVAASKKSGVDIIGKASIVGFCHVIFSRIDADKADEFISTLISGANIDETHPISALRARLIRDRGRIKIEARAELMFRAWTSFRKGKQQTKLQRGKKDKNAPANAPMTKLPDPRG